MAKRACSSSFLEDKEELESEEVELPSICILRNEGRKACKLSIQRFVGNRNDDYILNPKVMREEKYETNLISCRATSLFTMCRDKLRQAAKSLP